MDLTKREKLSDRTKRWLDAIYGAEGPPQAVREELECAYYYIRRWGQGDLSPEYILMVSHIHDFRVIILDAVRDLMPDDGTETTSDAMKAFQEEARKREVSLTETMQAQIADLEKQEEDEWRNQR